MPGRGSDAGRKTYCLGDNNGRGGMSFMKLGSGRVVDYQSWVIILLDGCISRASQLQPSGLSS